MTDPVPPTDPRTRGATPAGAGRHPASGHDDEDRRLDGNAAGGALRTVFATEATAAVRTCGGCDTAAPLAEHAAFLDAPGTVLRCPGCGDVALRIVTAPGRIYVELSGTRLLELPA